VQGGLNVPPVSLLAQPQYSRYIYGALSCRSVSPSGVVQRLGAGFSIRNFGKSAMQAPQAIEQLVQSVKQAGALLLDYWPGAGRGADGLQIKEKADGSLISKADLESNQIILEALTRLFPNDAILSEEVPSDAAALARSNRIWVVDPLDGTASFIHGRDDFSVLVGLAEKGVPTFGIMLFPALGKLIVTYPDRGVLSNGERIAVSTSTELLPSRVYIRNFISSRPELASPMMDSGLALLKVASGELDGAVIKMTTHQEWDLAAPAAVLLAAGGMITDQTGAPLRFGRGIIDFEYTIVSNGIIHKQLQHLIAAP
jgi:3'(2'), 5'-bisphosphate nucleotidase